MNKLDCLGISSYYEELPRGEKDGFVRDVAEAIGQSTSNVRLKMRTADGERQRFRPSMRSLKEGRADHVHAED